MVIVQLMHQNQHLEKSNLGKHQLHHIIDEMAESQPENRDNLWRVH